MNQGALEALGFIQDALSRDTWAGGHVLRGELPVVPTVPVLPSASLKYAYRLLCIPGDGSTTADVVYVCLRNSSGAWGWRTAATG